MTMVEYYRSNPLVKILHNNVGVYNAYIFAKQLIDKHGNDYEKSLIVDARTDADYVNIMAIGKKHARDFCGQKSEEYINDLDARRHIVSTMHSTVCEMQEKSEDAIEIINSTLDKFNKFNKGDASVEFLEHELDTLQVFVNTNPKFKTTMQPIINKIKGIYDNR